MRITFLTIFPASFSSFPSCPVISRAVEKGIISFDVVDIREYADGCFRAVDDSPYGGGAGLLLRADTLTKALEDVKTGRSRTILLGPKGKKFTQTMAHELAGEKHIILVAGHYEGVDERFRSHIDDEISIGDYILTGGESAAMIVAEAVTRLLEGALRGSSAKEESFEDGILEYPQYTHPAVFEGKAVPEVLMSGDRKRIAYFNETEALKDTIRLRPDLLSNDRDFSCCSLHKYYGNEADIIRWIKERLPVPEILYEDETYLILSKKKGKSLKDCTKNRILKTCAAILKAFWAMDVSDCPCCESIEVAISKMKERKLSYAEWNMLQKLEGNTGLNEDRVFSHGNLKLDNIIVNGNGLLMLTGMQKAGTADRYRDLAILLPSLEEAGIRKEELFSLLDFEPDDEKIEFFRDLNSLVSD